MDIRSIKEIVIRYRAELVKRKIRPDVIILFGSQARGTATEDSDIDLAIVSKSFKSSGDRVEYGKKLSLAAYKIDARIEAIPIPLKDYMDPHNISPILDQIKKTGTVLF